MGAGMISGFRPKDTMVPARPTAADRRKPVLERSIRYHKRGFAIAKVRETCIVEAHGTFLCEVVSLFAIFVDLSFFKRGRQGCVRPVDSQ